MSSSHVRGRSLEIGLGNPISTISETNRSAIVVQRQQDFSHYTKLGIPLLREPIDGSSVNIVDRLRPKGRRDGARQLGGQAMAREGQMKSWRSIRFEALTECGRDRHAAISLRFYSIHLTHYPARQGNSLIQSTGSTVTKTIDTTFFCSRPRVHVLPQFPYPGQAIVLNAHVENRRSRRCRSGSTSASASRSVEQQKGAESLSINYFRQYGANFY